MAAVCVLLQMKTDWATAKQILGDAQFLNKLINFDKNAVPEKVSRFIPSYIFTVKIFKKINVSYCDENFILPKQCVHLLLSYFIHRFSMFRINILH